MFSAVKSRPNMPTTNQDLRRASRAGKSGKPAAAQVRPLWQRLIWLVSIWAASVLALTLVAYLLRVVMNAAGLTSPG